MILRSSPKTKNLPKRIDFFIKKNKKTKKTHRHSTPHASNFFVLKLAGGMSLRQKRTHRNSMREKNALELSSHL